MKKINRDSIIDLLSINYFVVNVKDFKIVDSNDPEIRIGHFCYDDICHQNKACADPEKDCPFIKIARSSSQEVVPYYHILRRELHTNSYCIKPIFDDKNLLTHFLVQSPKISKTASSIDNTVDGSISDSNNLNNLQTVSIYNKDGEILYANKQSTLNLSNQEDSILGRNISEFVTPAQTKKLLKEFKTVISTNKTLQQDIPIHFTDQIKWFSNKMESIRFGPDFIPAVLSTSVNITDRIISKNKQQQNESTFKMIAENVSDVIWKFDLRNYQFSYISPSIFQLRGLTVEEALNESLEESLHPDDYQLVIDNITNAIQEYSSGSFIQMENRYEVRQYHKDHSLIWVEISASLINDENNTPIEILGISRDITDKRTSKENLIQSLEREKFFGDIIRNSSQAIGVGYPDGSGVLINQAAYDLLGYTEKELEKMSWMIDLTPEEWQAKEMELLNIAISEKKSITYEKEYIHKNGHHIPVELVVHPKFNKKGDLIHFIAFIADITERKKTQELLLESKNRLEYALKGSNDGLWDWNMETNALYMSPRYLEMIGYDASDLEPTFSTFEKLVHVDDLPNIFNIHDQYLSGEAVRFEAQFRLKHKKGHWVPILSRSYKITDETGKAIRLVGTHIDLTELQKVKRTLQESEEKYKVLFENTNVGIAITTLDGDLLNANHQLLKFLGLTFDSYVGINIRSHYLYESDREAFVNQIGKKGQLSNFHFQIQNLNGQSRWISLSSKIILINGEKRLISILFDIDKQIKAEELLKESEGRFKQFSKLTMEGILIHDQGLTVDINEALLKILEYKRKDVLGKNIIDMCSTDKSRPIFYKNVNSKSTASYEAEVLSKSGKVIPVEVSSKNAKYNGKTVRVTSIRDISKRIETEALLKKLSTAVEQSANSVVITDIDGNIEYVNPQFINTTSYSFEEVKGKNPRILKGGELPNSKYKELWDTITAGNVWQGEFLNKDKNNQLFWENATITPIRNNSGEITNYLAIKENITQRKKDRQEIEDMSKRLSMAIRAANFGIWELNLITKEIFWDEKMHEIYKVDSHDDLNKFKHFKKTVFKNHWTKLIESITFGIDHHSLIDEEFSIHVEGETKHLKSYVQPVVDADNNQRLIGITYDISEQKLFEKEIIDERKKALESDQLKSAFLANMSHEIRTPLNGIIGFTDLLQDFDNDFTQEEKNQYLKIISNNGQMLLHLVNDIIDISKIETGQLHIGIQKAYLKDIIIKVKEAFEPQILQKGLELICMDTSSDIILNTDFTRLVQILNNLIGNALKFTESGHIKIGYQDKGSSILFYVEDTGCGISKDAQGIIFNRFAQGKPIRDQLLGGTGLGLSITKGLVELLGGKIWLESEEEKGSVFYFTINKNIS
ncbi:MAG: PAS domain S-box protein [Bacteroidales bacterium]|nr:PAS domain S-box protein [Bacteroidales bacterium]